MRSMIIAVAAGLAALAGAAQAQPIPSASDIQSLPPTPERLRLAQAVFDAAGGAANLSGSAERLIDGLTQDLTDQGFTAQTSSGQAARDAMIRATMDRYMPRIVDSAVRAYAETFDEGQLRDLLAFYRSPTGQALRAKLPDLAARNGAALAALMPQITADILGQVCNREACTPAQIGRLNALKQQLPAR